MWNGKPSVGGKFIVNLMRKTAGIVMRWLAAICVLFVGQAAFAQENEAEKLFRAMEKRLKEAKSLKVICEADYDLGSKAAGKMQVSLYVKEGNKLSFTASTNLAGKDMKMVLISDGKTAVIRKSQLLEPEFFVTHNKLHALTLAIFARGGLSIIDVAARDEKFDIAKVFPVSDFKLGGKEKIGKFESQVVEFTASPDGGKATVKIWIDEKSKLPVKRVSVSNDKQRVIFGELYSEIVVDSNLDDKLFDIRKATEQPEANAAEKLFRAMEKKIREAKSLSFACDFEGSVELAGHEMKIKVSAHLDEGNKAWYESREIGVGAPAESILISDGKQMYRRQGVLVKPDVEATDKELNTRIAGALARAGFMLWRITKRPVPNPFDVDKLLPVGDFQLGAKERIGKVDTQVVTHVAKLENNEDMANVKIWIDTSAMLPVKRQVEFTNRPGASFIESYTEFTINPKLNAKLFEIPE